MSTIRTSLGVALGTVAIVVSAAVGVAPTTFAATPIAVKVSGPSRAAVPIAPVPIAQAVGEDSIPAKTRDNQVALMQYNHWLDGLQKQNPGLGYIASIDDPTLRSVTLLWVAGSPLPPEVRLRASSANISLSLTARTFPLVALQNSAQRVLSASAALQQRGLVVADVVAVDAGFDGIILEGKLDGSVTSGDAAVGQIQSFAQQLAGAVPVRLKLGVSAGPALGRGNDYAPFNAGGLMYSPAVGEICSSGYSVSLGSATHTTTARHCVQSDYVAIDAQYNQYATGSTAPTPDGAARILGGSGSPLIWDGTYDQQDFQKVVRDFGDVSIGDYGCSDGANSGVHCYIQVTDAYVYFDDGYGAVSTLKAETTTAGQIAVIQGDSGGPVLFPLSSGNDVLVEGMIQAYNGTPMTGSACGQVRFAGGNVCTTGILFTSMRTIVNSVGGSLVIG